MLLENSQLGLKSDSVKPVNWMEEVTPEVVDTKEFVRPTVKPEQVEVKSENVQYSKNSQQRREVCLGSLSNKGGRRRDRGTEE